MQASKEEYGNIIGGSERAAIFSGHPMITSRANDNIRRYRGLLSKPEPGFVCLEGPKLIADCIEAGAKLVDMFISPRGIAARGSGSVRRAVMAAGGNVWEVSDPIIDYMCDTEHPQGMAAVAAWSYSSEIPDKAPVIALDGVQDPGNVGAIIRTAAAFGFGAVVLGGDTAAASSPKAARASMGSIFRIRILQVRNLKGALEGMKECGFAIVGLDMAGEVLSKASLHGDCCLVVGSEGNGLSDGVKAATDRLMSIPMRCGVESLNASVAASVAMWELSGRP